jgi:glutathione reductase (NADPH)
LPRRIAFIGGGYISFEFAHIAARAGAVVTLFHRGPRPLPRFDPDLVEILVERTRALGVDVRLTAAVREVRRDGEGYAVESETAGVRQPVGADAVFHGAGRVPALDGLALDTVGTAAGPRGIAVNAYLQSVSNPAVYAAGDCADTQGAPLTPVASLEGRVAARNMLEGNVEQMSYPAVPSVVFTVPPLARVGLLESEARERGFAFDTHFARTGGWYSTLRVGESHSAYKVLVESGSGRVLGAHLLGPGAEEQVNLFAMAMNAGLTGSDVQRMIFAYPTYASDIGYML